MTIPTSNDFKLLNMVVNVVVDSALILVALGVIAMRIVDRIRCNYWMRVAVRAQLNAQQEWQQGAFHQFVQHLLEAEKKQNGEARSETP